jgi:hypothetical protein
LDLPVLRPAGSITAFEQYFVLVFGWFSALWFFALLARSLRFNTM